MGQLYLPPTFPLVKAARGWPNSPDTKPSKAATISDNTILRPTNLIAFKNASDTGPYGIYDYAQNKFLEGNQGSNWRILNTRFGKAWRCKPDTASSWEFGSGDADDIDVYPHSALFVFFTDQWETSGYPFEFRTANQFAHKAGIEVGVDNVYYTLQGTDYTPNTTFTLGKVHAIAYRVAAGDQQFFHNGQDSYSNTLSGWNTPGGGVFNGRWNNSIIDMRSNVLMFAKFRRRALSNDQLRYLSLNPYSLLEPANQSPYLVGLPAAAAYPISLSNGTMVNVGVNEATPQVDVTY